jgi:putative photosynthetic complex assembly protein
VSGHHHNEALPKAALIGAASCVGITLALTGAVALGIVDRPVTMQQSRIAAHMEKIAQRDLQFLDQKGGAVLINDVSQGGTPTVIHAGSKSGFIRGVMRGMARDRHLRGLGPEQPFRLTLWANQNLALEDRATGRIVELNGFGDTNRDAFLALLPIASGAEAAKRNAARERGEELAMSAPLPSPVAGTVLAK